MKLTTRRRSKSRAHPRAARTILAHARCSPRVTKLRPAPGSPPFSSLDFSRRELVTPVDAARHLGCSLQHVYNLITEGHLHAINIARPGRRRRCYRIPVECWRKFLANHSLQFPSTPQTQNPTSTHPTT